MLNQGFIVATGGEVNPSRFVKVATGGDFQVNQCGLNEKPLGISQEGTHDAPGVTSNTYAATAGQEVMIYGLGDVCLLSIGGSVTRADYLRSNASGQGVAIDTSGTNVQNVGAQAFQSGSSGDLISVQVVRFSSAPSTYLSG